VHIMLRAFGSAHMRRPLWQRRRRQRQLAQRDVLHVAREKSLLEGRHHQRCSQARERQLLTAVWRCPEGALVAVARRPRGRPAEGHGGRTAGIRVGLLRRGLLRTQRGGLLREASGGPRGSRIEPRPRCCERGDRRRDERGLARRLRLQRRRLGGQRRLLLLLLLQLLLLLLLLLLLQLLLLLLL
jgi:hypothetical protein